MFQTSFHLRSYLRVPYSTNVCVLHERIGTYLPSFIVYSHSNKYAPILVRRTLREVPSSLQGEEAPCEEHTAPRKELTPYEERFVSREEPSLLARNLEPLSMHGAQTQEHICVSVNKV